MSDRFDRLFRSARVLPIVVMLVTLAMTSVTTVHAQTEVGAIAGVVLDPDTKAVVAAGIVIRNEGTGDVRTTTTDGTGRFSASGLPPGVYTIEVGAPGFDIVQRSGVQVAAGTSQDIPMQLSIANIAETVTVSAALPAAAVAAPSQGSLTARSAESMISNEYIRNNTST